MPMQRICAWCQRDLGTVPGPEGMVTHGMCTVCEANFRAEIRESCSAVEVACDPDDEPAQDRPKSEEES